jgi:hypothetical protein
LIGVEPTGGATLPWIGNQREQSAALQSDDSSVTVDYKWIGCCSMAVEPPIILSASVSTSLSVFAAFRKHLY